MKRRVPVFSQQISAEPGGHFVATIKELLLGNPIGYQLFQRANGAEKMRKIFTREYIRTQPGYSILDVACGTADIRPYLGFDVTYTGIDLSKSYISQNQKKYSRDHTTQFICINLNDYIASVKHTRTFDVILLMGILHHLNDKDAQDMLAALPTLLRPGGRAITLDGVFTPNLTTFERFLLRSDRGKFVRALDAWQALFSSCLPDATYTIRKDLYYLPYNLIIFQYQRPLS